MDFDLPPPQAFFSGYFMNYPSFQKLVLALKPQLVAQVEEYPRRPYIFYVSGYDKWRVRLPIDEREKAPVVKVFEQDGFEPQNPDSLVFFPTRFVPVGEDDTSNPEDHPLISKESEIDRNTRDELILLIEQSANFCVDRGTLRFACVKHEHPFYDPMQSPAAKYMNRYRE